MYRVYFHFAYHIKFSKFYASVLESFLYFLDRHHYYLHFTCKLLWDVKKSHQVQAFCVDGDVLGIFSTGMLQQDIQTLVSRVTEPGLLVTGITTHLHHFNGSFIVWRISTTKLIIIIVVIYPPLLTKKEISRKVSKSPYCREDGILRQKL